MVTGLCAGILGIVFLVLTGMVGMQRRKSNVVIGDGGDDQLIRAMRRQANFVETAPLALFLMFLCELNVSDIFGAAPNYIYGIGGALVVGRILHAVGMTNDKFFKFRAAGMMLTILAILVSSIMLMYQFATA
jgi:uncharacterized membrane protein YecN with MAPEG domain